MLTGPGWGRPTLVSGPVETGVARLGVIDIGSQVDDDVV